MIRFAIVIVPVRKSQSVRRYLERKKEKDVCIRLRQEVYTCKKRKRDGYTRRTHQLKELSILSFRVIHSCMTFFSSAILLFFFCFSTERERKKNVYRSIDGISRNSYIAHHKS